MFRRALGLVLVCAAAIGPRVCWCQIAAKSIDPGGPGRPANMEGTYAAIRAALPAGAGVNIHDLTLKREGGEFHFDSGSFYFFSPVNGRITGAVFVGKGHFGLSPQEAGEQHSLALLTKSGVMSQDFATVVLRFTDGTAEEIRKASTGPADKAAGSATQPAVELARDFRQKLHENIELRMLEDILGAQAGDQGDFFLASFRMGGLFTGKNVLFIVDPQGTPHASPDQVELDTWSEYDVQTWAAYRMSGGKNLGVTVHVTTEKLDVTFDRSGAIKASAETTMTVRRGGVRVVRLKLYPTLRVTGVFDEHGLPLEFVQEDKMADPDFAIILPSPPQAGQNIRLLTKYGGPDAVRREGPTIYYLMGGARDRWYPAGYERLGGFADYHMTFHVPKDLQIVATGKEISHEPEAGGGTRAVWATEAPIAVAGFNLGEFKSLEAKTPDGFSVSAYANVDLPDYLGRFANRGMGTLSTVPALKTEVAQGDAAVQVFTSFFGKLPYDHVALTQQSACNYGQSWPMLVYLPTCAFWDNTVQGAFGLLRYDRSYWQDVTPHEVSHQWWGQLVGFNSYRDQWMSEGFANFSVGVYLLQTRPNMNDYRDFWNEQHKNLLQKNTMGVRPIDAGALTMGARVNNEKSGENIYSMLIYSKGAYIMHMLEMMYWTPSQKEEPFKRSLQTFVQEYAGKAATTEDFKHSFEKTMPKWLDVRGDGKLDWFFDEYVYGTELPHYAVTSEFTNAADGTSVHVNVTQSQVSKDFVMVVPLYLQMEDGNTVRLTNLTMRGNNTFDRTLKLGKLPSPGKKLMVNYNADVLSE